MTRRCLREVHELQELLRAGPDLRDTVCQGFAVPAGSVAWDTARVDGLIMLGCTFEDPVEQHLAQARGALLFPRLPDLPYDPYRPALYRPDELVARRRGDLRSTSPSAAALTPTSSRRWRSGSTTMRSTTA